MDRNETEGLVIRTDQIRGYSPSARKSPFLTHEEAANYLRLHKNTLRNKRYLGNGPPYRKHGGRVVYHVEDLNKWSGSSKVEYW